MCICSKYYIHHMSSRYIVYMRIFTLKGIDRPWFLFVKHRGSCVTCLHLATRQVHASTPGNVKALQSAKLTVRWRTCNSKSNSHAKTRAVKLSSVESEGDSRNFQLRNPKPWDGTHMKNTHAALQLPFSITTTRHATQYLCHLRALSGATCTTAACLPLLAKWWIRTIWVALLGISSADCLIAGCIYNYLKILLAWNLIWQGWHGAQCATSAFSCHMSPKHIECDVFHMAVSSWYKAHRQVVRSLKSRSSQRDVPKLICVGASKALLRWNVSCFHSIRSNSARW